MTKTKWFICFWITKWNVSKVLTIQMLVSFLLMNIYIYMYVYIPNSLNAKYRVLFKKKVFTKKNLIIYIYFWRFAFKCLNISI